MSQPPLMRGIDGGARREDPDARIARGLRFVAATMRHVASEVHDTAYGPSLLRQAARLETKARQHDSLSEYPALRLV